MVHKTLFLAHCPGPVLKMHEWLPCAQFQFLCPAWDIYWSLECKPKKRLGLEDLDWLHRAKPSVVLTHRLLNYKQSSLYNPSCYGPTTVTALCKSQNWSAGPAILTKQLAFCKSCYWKITLFMRTMTYFDISGWIVLIKSEIFCDLHVPAGLFLCVQVLMSPNEPLLSTQSTIE